jgi:hypothetical protein
MLKLTDIDFCTSKKLSKRFQTLLSTTEDLEKSVELGRG